MRSNKILVLIIFVILGVFIGSLLARFLGEILPWLRYASPSYGIAPPFVLSLGILELTFGLKISLSVANVIGILIALIFYRQI